MPYPKSDSREAGGLLERVVLAMEGLVEVETLVDVVSFCERKDYLGMHLYPRQRLLLKLYYRVPLGVTPCWCANHPPERGAPSKCLFCGGSTIYDELADARRLLSCPSKYSRLYFPDITREEAGSMPDEELRERLLAHNAFILEVVAGRRGSKSVLGAIVAAYELYSLLREADPHGRWGILRQDIGIANAAVDEKQALILFGQMMTLIEGSPWFSKYRYKALQSEIDFLGRKIHAWSLHSNSSSIRGRALKSINIDEYWHFNKTTGKQSDQALWAGLTPSLLTFHSECRIVLTSSPWNKAGKMWDIMDLTSRGEFNGAIVVQLSTWEMNPNYPRDCDFLISQYALDPEYAEVEYGAQIAESVGYFIPWEAIDSALSKDNHRTLLGHKGTRYHLHVDLSKRKDRTGLHVCHWDAAKGMVVTDIVQQWNPKDPDSGATTPLGEIDHDAIYAFIDDLLAKGFRFATVTFDQFNSAGLIQRLRRRLGDVEGKTVFEVTDNEKVNRESYSAFRSVITQGMYSCYEQHEYKRQLKELSRVIKETGQWKVEVPPGRDSFDDLADSAAIAVWLCLQYAQVVRSGIHVVEINRHLSPPPDPPTYSDGVLEHSPLCTAKYCDQGCPYVTQRRYAPV